MITIGDSSSSNSSGLLDFLLLLSQSLHASLAPLKTLIWQRQRLFLFVKLFEICFAKERGIYFPIFC